MSNQSILTFLSLLFIQYNLVGQEYAIEKIPIELKSRATAIVRHEFITLDMRNETNIIESVTRAITILNKAGETHAELLLFYDKSKSVKEVKGAVYNELGIQMNKFSLKDFKDYSATGQVSMYDDIRVKHYQPSISVYPYTVVYSYEIKHSQNLFIPYWRPNYYSDLAVEKSSYQFQCQPQQALRIKTENIPAEAKIETTDKSKTYIWTATNLPARKDEPFSPIEYAEGICVKVVPEQFKYYKKEGQVNDWEQFGKWVYDDLLKDKKDLSQIAKNNVRDIIKSIESPKAKAKALYEYMQSKTRYISIQVGIGGLEPFPASYVERLGYGDCKALVNYMQALLDEADIPSYYCIVEAGNTKMSLDTEFANAVDGNHIILCIPFEGDTTWLECTSQKQPFGFLGDFTDDRLVLACTEEGGKVLRTPKYNWTQNLQIRNADLRVQPDGTVTGQIKTTFSGAQFENHFSNVFKNPIDQNKTLKEYYDVDNIYFNKVNYEISDTNGPVVIEKLDINIKSYVVKNGNNIIIHPNIFNISRSIPESRNRKNQLYINRGYTDIDELTFELSEDIKGKIMPVNKVLESPMGAYNLAIKQENNRIHFYRKLEIKEGLYATEDYQKYFDFMKEVSASDKGKYNLPLAINE
ncbi:DUF3857 domain-containing protein [Sphingobacterium pedocola]|uniref:DUF3857 domain-containing protein n=1 Tax=Sphingobacterium pedocola TaxID=2082722 RepID=A0ABR9TBZ0_9SPHI|nr:DUF3857 domain-containing protein [Sphingobacterium pedocola]MBE8722584.1 hypothetical protein [Sphingobacterium pedocola]